MRKQQMQKDYLKILINFFRDNIDGEQNRFLMINKKDKPIGARFNWGIKGTKTGLKQMLDNHKMSQFSQQSTFHYTDKRGKKRPIQLDMNIPMKRGREQEPTV